MSPWVRRGIIAGGFGTGNDISPVEVAPVVPAQDKDFANAIPSPDWQYEPGSSKGPTKTADAEAPSADDVYTGKESAANSSEGPLLSTLTPFIHVDLASAVRSAERGVQKVSSH